MIRHVVLLKFKNPETDVSEVATRLQWIEGKMDGLLSVQTGVNLTAADRNFDLCLIADFVDLAALEGYSRHPAHLEIRPYIYERLESAVVVDFECASDTEGK